MGNGNEVRRWGSAPDPGVCSLGCWATAGGGLAGSILGLGSLASVARCGHSLSAQVDQLSR